MLIDLAILIDQATMTYRIAIVLVNDIQPGDGEGHLTGMTKLTGTEISPLPKKIKDIDARIDTINTGVNAPVTMDALIRQTEPPFTKRVMKVKSFIQVQITIPARSVRREDKSHGSLGLI